MCFYMFSTTVSRNYISWHINLILLGNEAIFFFPRKLASLITDQRPRARGPVFPRVVQWECPPSLRHGSGAGVPAGRPWARGPLAPETFTSQHPSACVDKQKFARWRLRDQTETPKHLTKKKMIERHHKETEIFPCHRNAEDSTNVIIGSGDPQGGVGKDYARHSSQLILRAKLCKSWKRFF